MIVTMPLSGNELDGRAFHVKVGARPFASRRRIEEVAVNLYPPARGRGTHLIGDNHAELWHIC